MGKSKKYSQFVQIILPFLLEYIWELPIFASVKATSKSTPKTVYRRQATHKDIS